MISHMLKNGFFFFNILFDRNNIFKNNFVDAVSQRLVDFLNTFLIEINKEEEVKKEKISELIRDFHSKNEFADIT